jgi:hypothetical protein
MRRREDNKMMSDTEFGLLVDSKKKSGAIAALLNLVLPGAGYAYCGRWFLGIIAFFFTVLMILVSLGFAALAVWLILITDGFLCASRYNKKLIERMIEERQKERARGAPILDSVG